VPSRNIQPEENIHCDEEDQVVVLDVHLKTRILDSETKELQTIQATMALQREPTETAQRTLRRIEISTQRKIESAKRSYKALKTQRRTSISASTMEDPSSSILVFGLDACGTCEETPEGEDNDLDGYRPLEFNEEMENKDLWLGLKGGPKSRLWMDVLAEKESEITLDLEPCPVTIRELLARLLDGLGLKSKDCASSAFQVSAISGL